METEEANSLIAIFDGWAPKSTNAEKNENKYVKQNPKTGKWAVSNAMTMPYSSKWHWLMPVVQKCCAELRERGVDERGSWSPEFGYSAAIMSTTVGSPIEKVYANLVIAITQIINIKETKNENQH